MRRSIKDNEIRLNRLNILFLLSELNYVLTAQYLSKGGIQPFNILVVGDAAMALKYEFYTADKIDCGASFNIDITEAQSIVASSNNLPVNWLKWGFAGDFYTNSYSIRLYENAVLCTTIGNMSVFVVNDLDHLCMYMHAGAVFNRKCVAFLCGSLCVDGVSWSKLYQRFMYLYESELYMYNKNKIVKEFKKYKMYF